MANTNVQRGGASFTAYCRFVLENYDRGLSKAEMARQYTRRRHSEGKVAPSPRQLRNFGTDGVIFGPDDERVTAWTVAHRIRTGQPGWTEALIGETGEILVDSMRGLLLQGIEKISQVMKLPGVEEEMGRDPVLALQFARQIEGLDKRVKAYIGTVSMPKRAEDAAGVVAALLEKFPEIVQPLHLLTKQMLEE